MCEWLGRAHSWGARLADVQVTCINKQPRDDPHEGITHLGGASWKWTQGQVIASIEGKTNTFYTLNDGRRAGCGRGQRSHWQVRADLSRWPVDEQPTGASRVPVGRHQRIEVAAGAIDFAEVVRLRTPDLPTGDHAADCFEHAPAAESSKRNAPDQIGEGSKRIER